MADYEVKQGDSIASLAKAKDIPSAEVWKDGANVKALANTPKRTDPNLLYPGDVVDVPDNTVKSDSGAATSKKHDYQIGSEYITVEVRLLDGDHKPHKSKKVEVKIDGTATTTAGPTNKCSGTTDGDGVVKIEKVMPDAKKVELSYTGRTVELQIGWLDPVDTKSGAIGRLQNLGYLKKELTAEILDIPDDDADYVAAIKSFQAQYVYTTEGDKAKIDGRLSKDVTDKLKTVHGC